jgi:phage-related baseplate assembly protein
MSDINFVETDPETIVAEMVDTFEAAAGRTLSPADPWKVAIMWAANIVVQERTLINQSARKNLLMYAKGEYLDALAELFHDCTRLEAEPAVVTMRFYISEAQSNDITIKAGTRVTADNSIYFATQENTVIKAGMLYIDVTAECTTSGSAGNGYATGQINTLVDIFNYYQSCENTTTSQGGSDEETDTEFYERIKMSNETWSTAGPKNAYIYFAKSVSEKITDVQVVSDEPGEVVIYILLNNGEIPEEALLNEVEEALNNEKIRPLTDSVTAKAPVITNYDIEFTYYISTDDESEEETIKTAVTAAVEEYKTWQSKKMGRDINPSKLISLVMGAGAKRVEVTSPQYNAVESNNVAVCENETTNYGGFEDE